MIVVVVVGLQARQRAQAQPHHINNNDTGPRAAAPRLLQKVGGKNRWESLFPEGPLNILVFVRMTLV